MVETLLYIHGFDSTPDSFKGQALRRYLQDVHPNIDYVAPQLGNDPNLAIAQLSSIIEAAKGSVSLVGSSLGGFYALVLAQRFSLRAALVNPAIYPNVSVQGLLGWNTHSYTGERFELTAQHVSDLECLQVEPQAHEYQNYLLMLQSGDETLDFLQASQRFSAMRCIIEYGGDHSFVGFDRWLPELTKFLRIGQ